MNFSKLAKRMMTTILIITLIGIVISAVYYRSWDFLPFLYGGLLGALTSIVKVILLDKAVDKLIKMEGTKARNYAALQNIVRLAISVLALLAGALIPGISLWGVALGILAYQPAAYSARSVMGNS